MLMMPNRMGYPGSTFEGSESEDGQRFRRGRDLRVALLEYYALFVGSVLVVGLFIAWLANTRLERDRVSADIQLAQALSTHLDTIDKDVPGIRRQLMAWMPILTTDQDISISIVDPLGSIVIHQPGKSVLPADTRWEAWLERTAKTTLRSVSGSFISTDPSGVRWTHSYTASQESGWRVSVQRPSRAPFALNRSYGQGLLIAVTVYLIAGLFFWLALSRQVISPLERLEVFSGLVRWRGQATSEELNQLGRLSARQDQVGSLARSLVAMAEQIEARFLELSALLATTQTVAGSLEEITVIDSILDEAHKLLAVDFSAVLTLDKRAGVLRIRSSRGLPEEYANQLRVAATEPNSPSIRALRKLQPVQVSDVETDLSFAEFRDRARSVGYRSLLATPLLTKHAPPAVLLLYKSIPYRYSFSELELISSFANHATIAMENAALYQRTGSRLREQTRRLEAIVESLTDGLFLESLSGEVLFCNQQTANLLDLPREAALDMTSGALTSLLLESAINRSESTQKYQEAIFGNKARTFDMARYWRGGVRQDLRVTIFDVTGVDGNLIGRGQLWRDITRDKELDRMKSTLLSTVSHELRTPLAAIKGFATTLLAEDVTWEAAAQREFVQTINDETDRLNGLVESLLEMSRIDAGMLGVRLELQRVDDLISETVQNISPAISQRVTVNLPINLPPVWMDISLLQTVMRNLVENADKYSPPDAPIEITARRENHKISIAVHDFGPGVPEDIQDKIFTPFFRADDGLTRRVGGVGLGLAICKGLVEANNGEVWVKDGDPGTIFGFSLPIKDE